MLARTKQEVEAAKLAEAATLLPVVAGNDALKLSWLDFGATWANEALPDLIAVHEWETPLLRAPVQPGNAVQPPQTAPPTMRYVVGIMDRLVDQYFLLVVPEVPDASLKLNVSAWSFVQIAPSSLTRALERHDFPRAARLADLLTPVVEQSVTRRGVLPFQLIDDCCVMAAAAFVSNGKVEQAF